LAARVCSTVACLVDSLSLSCAAVTGVIAMPIRFSAPTLPLTFATRSPALRDIHVLRPREVGGARGAAQALLTLPVTRTMLVNASCRSSSSRPASFDVFWMTLSISLACAW
jgi:hypothetical protein